MQILMTLKLYPGLSRAIEHNLTMILTFFKPSLFGRKLYNIMSRQTTGHLFRKYYFIYSGKAFTFCLLGTSEILQINITLNTVNI